MAFTLRNWCRASASANEPIVTLASGNIAGCFREYNYYTADAQVTVAASSYFDDVAYDLVTGDYINVYSTNDGTRLQYRVTNTSGVITVTFVGGEINTQVSITNAQLLGAYAASVELLAAPGANRMYVLNYAQFMFDFDTGVTANGGSTHVQYSNTVNGAGTLASSAIAAATINAIAADSAFLLIPAAVTATANASLVNQGLYFANDTAAYTQAAGASTLICNIGARIVPTA